MRVSILITTDREDDIEKERMERQKERKYKYESLFE